MADNNLKDKKTCISNKKRVYMLFLILFFLLSTLVGLNFFGMLPEIIFYITLCVCVILIIFILKSKIIEIEISVYYFSISEQTLLESFIGKNHLKSVVKFKDILKIKFYYSFPKMVHLLYVNEKDEICNLNLAFFLFHNKEVYFIERCIIIDEINLFYYQ